MKMLHGRRRRHVQEFDCAVDNPVARAYMQKCHGVTSQYIASSPMLNPELLGVAEHVAVSDSRWSNDTASICADMMMQDQMILTAAKTILISHLGEAEVDVGVRVHGQPVVAVPEPRVSPHTRVLLPRIAARLRQWCGGYVMCVM